MAQIISLPPPRARVVRREDDRRRRREGVSNQDLALIISLLNSQSQQALAQQQFGLQQRVAESDLAGAKAERRERAVQLGRATEFEPRLREVQKDWAASQRDFEKEKRTAYIQGLDSSTAKSFRREVLSRGLRATPRNRAETEQFLEGLPQRVENLLGTVGDPFTKMGVAAVAKSAISEFGNRASDPELGPLFGVIVDSMPGLNRWAEPSNFETELTRQVQEREEDFQLSLREVTGTVQDRLNELRGRDDVNTADIQQAASRIGKEVIGGFSFKPEEVALSELFPKDIREETAAVPERVGSIPGALGAALRVPGAVKRGLIGTPRRVLDLTQQPEGPLAVSEMLRPLEPPAGGVPFGPGQTLGPADDARSLRIQDFGAPPGRSPFQAPGTPPVAVPALEKRGAQRSTALIRDLDEIIRLSRKPRIELVSP